MGNKFSTKKGKKGTPKAGEAESKEQGHKYLVSVVASQARGLLAKDVGGTSDPFLTLEVDNQVVKSSTVMASLTPVWNDRLEVVLENKPKQMTIKCFDWDRFSANDFIGSVTIDIPEAWWKSDEEVKYKWYDLAQKNNSPAGQVELQINARIVEGDENDDHSDAYFHSITHFLKVTVKEARNLKSADLLTPNDNVCKVSYGSQTFNTKVVHGANPVWNQSAWILVCQPRQQNFKVLVEVFDRDVISASDNIGAKYFEIANFMKSEAPVEYAFTPLNKFIATKDNQLSHGTTADDLNKPEETTGEISVTFQMFTKSQAQKQIFRELMRLVSGEDDEKSSSVLTRDHFDTAMLLIDPSLPEKTREELFTVLDKNADGELDQTEMEKILNSAKFNFTGLARKLLALAADPDADQSQLLAHVMDPEIKKKEGNIVIVKERESGLEVEENIPPYIKVAMQIMFANVIGRKFANRTIPLLDKMSRLQGEKYNKPESTQGIPAFIKLHNLNESEFDKDVKEYENFNAFFARGLKDQDKQRPIASPGDGRVAVCPADCRMMVFPEWTDAANLWVKGDKFTIENLIGAEASAQYGEWFKGGSFVIARLAPQDYHRWHTPVQGTFGKRFPIAGALYTVNPIAINQPVNVYTENKRCVCLIDTEEFGAVILIAVAATMVGSMEIDGAEHATCERGATHGKFFFGGSTILLIFQPGTIKFADDLLVNSTANPKRPIETLVKVRSKLGDATGKPGKRL
jgi:phosphatidylserine decarboxylase